MRGLVRAGLYLGALSVVFAACSIRAARAEMRDGTLTLGREMAVLARASRHDVTPIVFNGQRMYLGSSVTFDSAKDVLDRYEEHCRQDPGLIAPPAQDELGARLLRAGDDVEGSVVCFARRPGEKTTLTEAFRSFARTGELGHLGKLRYVYARKNPVAGKTLVLTAWTEDSFNLLEMMPAEGKDAPGDDFAEVPRVPASLRALSARAEGLPFGLNVYRSSEAPRKVLAFYDHEMVERGFVGFDPEMDEQKEGGLGRTYVKDGVVLTVATKAQPEGNFVVLGLAGVGASDPSAIEPRAATDGATARETP